MAVFCLILDMCSFLFSLLSYARGMVRRKKKRYSRSLVDLHVVCFDAELKGFADRLKDYVSHRLQRWYPLTSPTSQLAASISQLAGSRLWSLTSNQVSKVSVSELMSSGIVGEWYQRLVISAKWPVTATTLRQFLRRLPEYFSFWVKTFECLICKTTFFFSRSSPRLAQIT